MEVHLYVFDKNSQPTNPQEVTAAATLPGQDIGPLPVTLRQVDVGHAVGTLSVPMTGSWQPAVTVRTTTFDQYTDHLELPIH
jgi:copper transport protein